MSRYGPSSSTSLVACDPATFVRAGLDRMGEADSLDADDVLLEIEVADDTGGDVPDGASGHCRPAGTA